MNHLKRVTVAFVAVALAGCATFYTYDGQQYSSKQQFMSAVDAKNSAAVNAITPLQVPLTKKSLIFAFPSQSTILQTTIRYHTNAKGNAPAGQQLQIYQDLAEAAFKGASYFKDAISRRNVYSSVRMLELDSPMANPAPSADADVLVWNEPALGAGQWYFVSAKHGRQAFAFDRALPTMTERTKAFVDAVQLQAIRE